MTDLALKRVLVTGGAGFVGSHLVEKLVLTCDDVVVLDDFSNGKMENLNSVGDAVEIVKSDISLPFSEFSAILGDNRFDVIFHLACHPRSLSLANPVRDLEVNAEGTLNILEFARGNNSKVVFTSNSGIYGEPEYLPIDEMHPDDPFTPYDANKLLAEHYMKIYHRIYGLRVGLCRLATVYGERQISKDGWKPVIAEFALNALESHASTICWDGMQTRDLIYVGDVVQGLLKIASADTGDELFILGTDTETSINDIHDFVCRAAGTSQKPRRSEKTPGDIRRMRYSYNKAKKHFGFTPNHTLREGIKRYVDWLRGTRISGVGCHVSGKIFPSEP